MEPSQSPGSRLFQADYRESLICLGGDSVGAQDRNRTSDTVIFSHVLYQLSYLGTEPCGSEEAYF